MKTRVVILAGGEGSRLGTLTAKRTKPAVPFAGKYRIIDFTLSNCVNSDLYDIMIIAQYRPHSLIAHIGAGGPWDLNRDFSGGVRIYSPYKARRSSDWFAGTADAIQQNYTFIQHNNPDMVLILSGDHIYAMDYEPLITFHLDHHADLTMATIKVPMEEASRFGVVKVSENYQVTEFQEKPKNPTSNVVNMGVYLFNTSVLDKVLWEDHHHEGSSHDFGKDVIPKMIQENYQVYGFPYTGYWVDVGTTQSYWQAHMDQLSPTPAIQLNNRSWVIHTRTEERPPVYFADNSVIRNSMISDGCVIHDNAKVINSVLSPGVIVENGARVENSIVFTDTTIGKNTIIKYTIIDKQVTLGEHMQIGGDKDGDQLNLTVIGKGCVLPNNLIIEAGASIDAEVTLEDLPGLFISKDQVIQSKRYPNDL